jgi:hypothetical protein
MPSDRRPTAGQHLLRVLGSSERPFAYRSGIFRLLGLPSGAASTVAFRPPPPQGAFQYVQPHIPDASDRPPPNPSRAQAHAPGENDSPTVHNHHGTPGVAAAQWPTDSGSHVPTPPAVDPRPPPSRRPGRSLDARDADHTSPSPALGSNTTPLPGGMPAPSLSPPEAIGLAVPGATQDQAAFAALAAQPSEVQPVAATDDVQQAARDLSLGHKRGAGQQPPQAPGGIPAPSFGPPETIGLAVPGATKDRAAFAALTAQPSERDVHGTHQPVSPLRGAGNRSPRAAPMDAVQPVAATDGVQQAARDLSPGHKRGAGQQTPQAWEPQARPHTPDGTDHTPRDPPPSLQPAATRRARPLPTRPRPTEHAETPPPPTTGASPIGKEMSVAPPPAGTTTGQPPSREVLLVRPAASTIRRSPRSLWTDSTLRSRHLGVLR